MVTIIFWIAIIATLILLVQIVLAFIGADSEIELDADIDTEIDTDAGSRFFTVRNLVAFLSMFSWSWLYFYEDLQLSMILASIFAVIVGGIFIYIFMIIMKGIMSLSEENTKDFSQFIGETAQVYLTIPAQKNGYGIVTINGNVKQQVKAITNETEPIPTHHFVDVIGVENQVLIVKKQVKK